MSTFLKYLVFILSRNFLNVNNTTYIHTIFSPTLALKTLRRNLSAKCERRVFATSIQRSTKEYRTVIDILPSLLVIVPSIAPSRSFHSIARKAIFSKKKISEFSVPLCWQTCRLLEGRTMILLHFLQTDKESRRAEW
jgi:hypothetical protein